MSAAPGSFFARYRSFPMAPATCAAVGVKQGHPGGEIPMRQPQFIRSNTFHWALMVAGVFAVFVIVLFGFIYWQIDDYLTARSDRVITLELEGIAGLSPERRLQAMDEKLRQDPRGVQLAAIFAADGHRITGNIESLPPDLRIDAVAQAADIVKINGNGREHQIVRAIARRMRNGDVLVLGRNVDEAKEISHVVGQALGLGLLPGFCLCLLAGAWLSVRAQLTLERGRTNATNLEQLQGVADKAIAGIDQSLAIITALLRLAEIENSRRSASFADVPLDDMLREVCDIYEPIAENKNVTLQVAATHRLTVPGDRDLLIE